MGEGVPCHCRPRADAAMQCSPCEPGSLGSPAVREVDSRYATNAKIRAMLFIRQCPASFMTVADNLSSGSLLQGLLNPTCILDKQRVPHSPKVQSSLEPQLIREAWEAWARPSSQSLKVPVLGPMIIMFEILLRLHC